MQSAQTHETHPPTVLGGIFSPSCAVGDKEERILPGYKTVTYNKQAVFGFGHYLPRAQVYKSAHEQFGRQRGFPQTQQSFFTALRRVFKKDSSVLEWVDNKKTFVYTS